VRVTPLPLVSRTSRAFTSMRSGPAAWRLLLVAGGGAVAGRRSMARTRAAVPGLNGGQVVVGAHREANELVNLAGTGGEHQRGSR
jgi:hypothetical protein